LAIYDKLILQKSLTKEQWPTSFRRLALYGFRVRLQERKADLAHLILLFLFLLAGKVNLSYIAGRK